MKSATCRSTVIFIYLSLCAVAILVFYCERSCYFRFYSASA